MVGAWVTVHTMMAVLRGKASVRPQRRQGKKSVGRTSWWDEPGATSRPDGSWWVHRSTVRARTGAKRAPEALGDAGLVERTGARDAGDADATIRDPYRDVRTGVIGFEQL